MELTARIALALAWGAAGLLVLAHVRRGTALLAGLACWAAAAADLARWHVALLGRARVGLHESGLYDQRGPVKLGLGALGALLGLVLLYLAGRRLVSVPRGLRLSLVSSVAWLGFLLALTGFLDDFLPRALLQFPGRHALEAAFALPALWGALLWRRTPTEADAG